MRITIAQNSPSPDGSSRQAEDPEGRQAGRPPCRTADEVRAGDQPKDRRRRSDSRSRRRCCWARIRLSSDMNYRKLRSGFSTSNETPPSELFDKLRATVGTPAMILVATAFLLLQFGEAAEKQLADHPVTALPAIGLFVL